MKTLAIRQPWISLIAEGEKTIEARTWKTAYRGPLLLVASGKPLHVPIDDGETYTLPTGIQVCIVDLIDVRPMTPDDLRDACLDDAPGFTLTADHYAWILRNPHDVQPTPHKGRLNIYDTPDETILAA